MNHLSNDLYSKAYAMGILRKKNDGQTRVIGSAPCSISEASVKASIKEVHSNHFMPYYGM